MKISDELKEKIIFYLKDNDELKKRVLLGEVAAIREIGDIFKWIDPVDVVESYENNTMDYLYKKAKKLSGLKELYEDLLNAYSEQNDVEEPKKHI